MKPIPAHEYETLVGKFSAEQAALLAGIKHGNKPICKQVGSSVTFNSVVGVVRIGDLQVEILPKLAKDGAGDKAYRRNLIKMLHIAGMLDLTTDKEAALDQATDLFDILLHLFCIEVEQLMHRGLIKRYRKQQGNVNALKGKLMFAQHIKSNAFNEARFYTQHQVYDRQHPVHQLLNEALHLVPRMAAASSIGSAARQLLLDFPEQPRVEPRSLLKRKFLLDRKTNPYRRAIQCATWIIKSFHPSLVSKDDDSFSLLFDMNKVFERYVRNTLKNKLDDTYIVKGGKARFWHIEGSSTTANPDIVIKNREGKRLIVLDTKWKRLGNRPSDEDLRQLYTYQNMWRTNDAILLYPSTEASRLDGTVSRVEGYFHNHFEFENRKGEHNTVNGTRVGKKRAMAVYQIPLFDASDLLYFGWVKHIESILPKLPPSP